MLGPLEELLARQEAEDYPDDLRLVEVAYRNGLRLLKLVNSLLDFARIEAGRVQASYRAHGPGRLHRRSGFQLSLRHREGRPAADRWTVRRLPQPVYVDRDMWEKVVLNLISNAFKFTFEGEIDVALEPCAGQLRRPSSQCATPARASRRRNAAPVRALPSRGRRARAHARGNGHRPGAGAGAGEAAWRQYLRAKRTGARKHVHGTHSVRNRAPAAGAGRSRHPTMASTATRAEAYVDEALGWLPLDGERSHCRQASARDFAGWRSMTQRPRAAECCWPTTMPTCGTTSIACSARTSTWRPSPMARKLWSKLWSIRRTWS